MVLNKIFFISVLLSLSLYVIGTLDSPITRVHRSQNFHDGLPIIDSVPTIVFNHVNREIDVQTHIEHQTHEIKLSNTGQDPVSFFLFVVPGSKAHHLSIVTTEDNDIVDEVQLPEHILQQYVLNIEEQTFLQKEQTLKDLLQDRYFRIMLKSPLSHKQQTTVTIHSFYTNSLKPAPEYIEQNQKQYVIYEDTQTAYTIHPTQKQRLQVLLASSNILIMTPSINSKYVSVNDNIVALIETRNSKLGQTPLTIGRLFSVHYENNSPFKTITHLQRDIEVSHWGSISVTEKFFLQNTGAKLKGPFSRIDYMKSETSKLYQEDVFPHFRKLDAILPKSAHSVTFRDINGNVSSSNFKYQHASSLLEAETRYPLMGGWKTDVELSYQLPSYELLRYSEKDDIYEIQMPFHSSFQHVNVDSLHIRLILPEGSRNVQWYSSSDIDHAEISTMLSYLDIEGRVVQEFRTTNIINEHPSHNTYFIVRYQFSKLNLLREPLLIAVAFFSLLVVILLFGRLHLSFPKPKESLPTPSAILETGLNVSLLNNTPSSEKLNNSVSVSSSSYPSSSIDEVSGGSQQSSKKQPSKVQKNHNKKKKN